MAGGIAIAVEFASTGMRFGKRTAGRAGVRQGFVAYGQGHYKGAGALPRNVSAAWEDDGEAMQPEDSPVLIYTTFGALDDAKRIGRALVEAKLAACVNIFPGMVSIFEWQGALDETDEVAMIIKTRAGLAEAVLEETARLHPYEVPALLVIPTHGAGASYAAWIRHQTRH